MCPGSHGLTLQHCTDVLSDGQSWNVQSTQELERQVRVLNGSSTALIATDDEALAGTESSALAKLRFRLAVAHTDAELYKHLESDFPDLLILDSALPPAGGISVCRKLRENPETANLPILMVTSSGNGPEKIRALDAGADECMSQPLQADVLAAYVRALIRRTQGDHSKDVLRAGPIEMDLARWIVTVSGRPVELTKKEFSLLRVLLEAKGRALSRDFLLQKVWSHGIVHGLDTRTVDVHVGRLRRKLGQAGRYIITVRNVGFRFDIQPEWISRIIAN